jgi:D-glycero-D-manno-heptose 1,7-bisphosphate phosphatase
MSSFRPQPLSPLRTVFLDRDGVVNRKMPEGEYVTRWEQFELLPGVAEAIGRLNRAGVRAIVVSNQRGVALGRLTESDLNHLHAQLANVLEAEGVYLDAIFYCPHEKNSCTCRKPLPGMFEQARAAFPEIQAANSVMIGDSLSDIRFGADLGMRTIFIAGDPTRQGPGALEAARLAGQTAENLLDAVKILLDA